jgi:hypothetical protein
MALVEIVDHLNHERVLGYLTERPELPNGGGHYRMAAWPNTSLSCDFVASGPIIEVVDFATIWKSRDGGWRQDRVFSTRAPLDLLMKLGPKFRLPGEAPDQARYRVETQRFFR